MKSKIAIYETHKEAVDALKMLHDHGFPMKNVSLIGTAETLMIISMYELQMRCRKRLRLLEWEQGQLLVCFPVSGFSQFPVLDFCTARALWLVL